MGTQSAMWYRDNEDVQHRIEQNVCSECDRTYLVHSDVILEPTGTGSGAVIERRANRYVLLPRVSSRPPAPPDVPKRYADLYNEAALILTDSPRGSAALSRHCLQLILRDEAHAPHGTPFSEVEWVLATAGLPQYTTESMHELRKIANFANHPTMGAAGDYLDVEPGEAEWSLETLDALFDHYFVKPARTAALKAQLAAKLTS
jgi:hypothetical protein